MLSKLVTTPTPLKEHTSPVFSAHIEDHLDFLRDPGISEYIPVQPIDHSHYARAFYDYIRDTHSIDNPVHQFICLRVNNMFSPYDFDEKWTVLCLPTKDEMNKIINSFVSF